MNKYFKNRSNKNIIATINIITKSIDFLMNSAGDIVEKTTIIKLLIDFREILKNELEGQKNQNKTKELQQNDTKNI